MYSNIDRDVLDTPIIVKAVVTAYDEDEAGYYVDELFRDATFNNPNWYPLRNHGWDKDITIRELKEPFLRDEETGVILIDSNDLEYYIMTDDEAKIYLIK
jgi:hypothetical protein